MGRLFWKFFLSILLAQLTATVGIGGTFWLNDRARMARNGIDIDTSPPAQMAIDSAAATLEHGGTEALRSLLAGMERHRVYAVDESGRDLLGRIVKRSMLVEAQFLIQQPDKRRVVRQMNAKDGHRYLLFQPSAAQLNGINAGAGPEPGMGGPGMGRPGADAPPPDDQARNGRPGRSLGFMGWRGPPLDSPYRTVIPVVAATIASLLFAFLLAWYFSRPIRALRLAFEAASDGDLAPRFAGADGKRGDELSDLGRDFDRMTGRLRKLMDGQTRLLHDVSHELRSPLARLQAAIGLAHQQPEKVTASLSRIERESVRMDKLVGELLTLSRLEAGVHGQITAQNSEAIGFAELIQDIVDDAQFEASTHRRNLVVSGEADLIVRGQADLLARAIENVVRNAIKHSPEGGTVVLELERREVAGGGIELDIRVLDRGPGVDQADIATIFQPFFRASNTEKDTEGHGLGLAIAQHVVLAHGGSIAAKNREGGGLCVGITLPAQDRQD